jgi:2-phosphosulfolactate phosphatase
MYLDVFLTRHDLAESAYDLRGATVVVIDVLRASSTLAQALSSGAEEIHIAGSIEEANKLKEKFPDAVLCGEREGLIIPGFDFGNSPLDYTFENVLGKKLIFASTNGSLTLLACRGADEVLIGGFVNMLALIEELVHSEKVALVCSGKLGRFSIEDAVCAGMIIDRLSEKGLKITLQSDSAWTAFWLFERFISNPEEMLSKAEHPVYLAQDLGFIEDVAFCTRIGCLNVVPRYSNGVVTL